MCTQHILKSTYNLNRLYIYFIAIIIGIISGFSDFIILQKLGLVISEIFIKIFKCISLPIIALSIIVTLSQYNANDQMKIIWQKTIFYTIITTIIAATIACIMYLLIRPSNINSILDSKEMVNNSSQNSYLDYIIQIIPSNIFAPFLEHQVMGVLLVSMVVGIAIRYINDPEPLRVINSFFKGIHNIFIIITEWIVSIIPIALFGFISTAIVQIQSGTNIKGLGGYLMIIIISNIVQGLVILPTWLYLNKIKPFASLGGMLPALSVAFFSKSSTGTLPVTIETIERNLSVSPKISRFVLPLCTAINMNGCAAFIFNTVIYLMQNNGIEINLVTMLLWIFIATIAAIGNAGVPMGCFFLSASLLSSMNVPITLLGLILPFYNIIDMIETALNVWSDSCIAKVIDKKAKCNNINNSRYDIIDI